MTLARFFSYLLILAGSWLLATAGREYWESSRAQLELAAEWEPASSPAPRPAAVSLRRGQTLARLSIPRLEKDWFVLHGTDARTLRRGPGHLERTALPGANGNFVIAGHRDTHFRALKDIRAGDVIVAESAWGVFHYRVRGTEIVKPTNTRSIQPTSKGQLTLVTCYPFYWAGDAPERFVVIADLIPASETPGPNARL